VVAPRLPSLLVHALLHHDPAPVVRHDESVQVQIEAVLDGGAVDLGHEAARPGKRFPVQADALADRDELGWCVPAVPAPAAADVESEFLRQRRQAALQRADARWS
jgi:hypothetical protein